MKKRFLHRTRLKRRDLTKPDRSQRSKAASSRRRQKRLSAATLERRWARRRRPRWSRPPCRTPGWLGSMPEVTARKIRNLCIFKNSSCSKFFLPQSQLIKQVSPQAAQSYIFVKLHIIQTDAPPWRTRFRTLYNSIRWKVREEKIENEEKCPAAAWFKPSTLWSPGECSTAALQPQPLFL